MNEKILLNLGLTNAEAKTYLALLKTGTTTTGALLDETGLQSSTLYKTINSLVKKGYASYIIKGKTRYYQAADPDYLLEVEEERMKKLKESIPFLKQMQVPIQKQKAEIFEGFKGLKNMLYEMIEDAGKGDEYLFFAFNTKDPDKRDNVFAFYEEFEKERWKKGIKVRGIAPISLKEKLKRRRTENIYFVDMPIPMNMGIIKDKIMFTPWEDSEVSILIYSKQLADSFRAYFELVWAGKKAKTFKQTNSSK